MGNISLKLRLRPIRFGFIVRPDDKANIDSIFQINTCLWGGQYNPIIPFFKRLPPWWTKDNFRFDNARQVINGYLDFFEPDFIVEAERGLSNDLGFSSDRIIQLPEILVPEGYNHNGYGLSVTDLYQDLYKREFQFVRRNPHNMIDIEVVDPSFKVFSSCVFGGFPKQKNLYYFKETYQRVFEPEKVNLVASSLQEIYEDKKISPLQLGLTFLEARNTNHHQPTIFMLDATKANDLIDFWNFRAVYGDTLAIPIQWFDELYQFCKVLIAKSCRSLLNSRGINGYTVMFSRSIDRKKVDNICRILKEDKTLPITIQDWYPSIWRVSPQGTVRTTPPILVGKEKDVDIPFEIENPVIQFSPLHPEFAGKYGNGYRWANIVKIQSLGNQDQIATVFPSNYRNPLFPRLRLIKDTLLSTTEGLVIFPKRKNIQERWSLIDGSTAFNEWFKVNNIKEAKSSEAGKSTKQIIQTLGGFSGVRSVANIEIIRLLNSMSKSTTHCQHFNEFKNKVKNATNGSDFIFQLTFDTLVQKQAVTLGLELTCSKCGFWSWYPLNQIDYSFTCSRCLKQFSFPINDPISTRYAYRIMGPFSLPDYANGGYASALAVRFFADIIGRRRDDEVTWSAGQNLTLSDGQEIEADFILWYQRKMLLETDYPIEIIFGEAKSFGRNAFKRQDVHRMRKLATVFPGSILVFATMQENLSPKEVKLIRNLAEWGRKYDKEKGQTKAPVIILTSTELFTDFYLHEEWEKKGGKHKHFISQLDEMYSLKNLADLTQQLYLDMPSYYEWINEK